MRYTAVSMAEEENIVSCDILREKYAEVRAAGEAYKKVLYRFGTVSEAQEAKEVFDRRVWDLREMLRERKEVRERKFREFAESGNRHIRMGAAENLTTPPDVLKQLLRDEKSTDEDAILGDQVCQLAAANPNLPYDTLVSCVNSGDEDIRVGAAQNPSLPPELAEQLLRDDDLRVYRRAAANPNIFGDALRRCANSEDEWVRIGAAANPNLSLDLVNKLLQDEDLKHNNAYYFAVTNLDFPRDAFESYVNSGDKMIRYGIALNPNLPSDLVKGLLNDGDGEVRQAAAGNRNLSVDILRDCANGGDGWIRAGAAKNKNLPSDLAEMLMRDEERLMDDEDEDRHVRDIMRRSAARNMVKNY